MSYLHTVWCWFSGNLQDITLIATLFVLWRSMRAAERQSEGTFKPVLTLRRMNTTAPGEHEVELTANPVLPFQITNAGTGPALTVTWKFRNASGKEISGTGGRLPFIRAAQYVRAQVLDKQLGAGAGVFPVTLECSYESASGVFYRSTTRLENNNKLYIGTVTARRLRFQWVRRVKRWF
jgi:hypothetical protein